MLCIVGEHNGVIEEDFLSLERHHLMPLPQLPDVVIVPIESFGLTENLSCQCMSRLYILSH